MVNCINCLTLRIRHVEIMNLRKRNAISKFSIKSQIYHKFITFFEKCTTIIPLFSILSGSTTELLGTPPISSSSHRLGLGIQLISHRAKIICHFLRAASNAAETAATNKQRTCITTLENILLKSSSTFLNIED